MTFRRRLVVSVALALGLLGTIACTAAVVGVWVISDRVRNTTEAVFARIDGSLVGIQRRAERTRDRVRDSATSTESIAAGLKEWTVREAGERLALKVNLAEKSERLLSVLERADGLLESSSSSAESVQQAL